MIGVASRKTQLAEAFILADQRGLTAAEAEQAAGPCWRRRLQELRDDGWQFREDRRRFGQRSVFRWVLLYVPPDVPNACELPTQPVLFEPAAPRPVSALEAS